MGKECVILTSKELGSIELGVGVGGRSPKGKNIKTKIDMSACERGMNTSITRAKAD